MATYNRAHLLPHTIRSIINQTFTDWELIIVDDASSDNTPEVVRTFTQQDKRIRYHRHQHNSGLATARNTSVGLARGPYIALQDDDDISLPHRLQTQVDFLDKHPHVHLISNAVRRFNHRGFTSTSSQKPWLSDAAHPASIDSLAIMPITLGCAMGHHATFTQHATRCLFTKTEDYDFVLRCIEDNTIIHMPDVLYHYRQRGPSHKTSVGTNAEQVLGLWKNHLTAWLSAYYRRNGMADPVDGNQTIEQILRDGRSILKSLSRYPRRKLILLRSRRVLSLSLQQNDLKTWRATLALTLQCSTYVALCRVVLHLLPRLIQYPHRVAFHREILRAFMFPSLVTQSDESPRHVITQTTTTPNTPKVSVVMAVYNRAHLLPHAVRSIINQTFTDWELIIVDDASSDNTPEVVRAFTQQDKRIRYHRHQHNSGLATARNTSFELARGTYIALQDDDDISLPHRLQTQVDFLEQNPHIDLISSPVRYFNHDGFKRTSSQKPWLSDAAASTPIDSLVVMPIRSPCLMGRHRVLVSLSMRPFFSIVEDYDFILRCTEHYTIMQCPDVLYHYRQADTRHQTIGSGTERVLVLWKYHLAAWFSAYCRRNGMADPIDGRTIDEVLNAARPILKSLPRYPRRKLIRSHSRRYLALFLKDNNLQGFRATLALTRQLSTYRTLCRIILRLTPSLIRYPRPTFYLELGRALTPFYHTQKAHHRP